MAMQMHPSESAHISNEVVTYQRRIDSQMETNEVGHMEENIVDPTEYFHDEDTKMQWQELSSQRSVHQCAVCNKIFVSFKGLQQHAVIHTDQKPYQCDICGKSFRFKSNLFEHRSVHIAYTPHACPYCGKTCRLKGNLKKHLKTHVRSKEELEQAWKPFASNRRPPANIPDNAIIVRSASDALFTPPTRTRKRKLGLGPDPRIWTEKIRRGEIVPSTSLTDKMNSLDEQMKIAMENNFSLAQILQQARCLPLERFECPFCKNEYLSRLECSTHIANGHSTARYDRPLFCEVCLKIFADRKSMEQHESYHKRVHLLIEHQDVEIRDPEFLLPQAAE